MITRAGIVIARDFLPTDVLGKVRRKLTVTHTGFNNIVTSLQAHRTDTKAGTITLGRAGGLKILAKVQLENRVLPGAEIKADYKFAATLADHQMLIRDALHERFAPERIASGRAFANLLRKAGQGKSYIALSFVETWGRKTLYVVHNLETLAQTAELAAKLYPHLRIGQLSGKHDTDGDIVVAMITSVLKKSDKWYAEFHYTILDEIQKYCTTIRSRIFMRMSPVVLGMTATESLPNDMLRVVPLYLGDRIDANVLVEEKLPTAPIAWKVESVQVVYHGPPEYTRKMLSAGETVSHPLTVNMLSEDPGRLQLIVHRTMLLRKAGHIIFVMVDRRAYAAAIVTMLTGLKVAVDAPDIKIQKLIGGTPDDAKRAAKHDGEVCVVTYACGGVGLSYSRYDAVVFAHPRRNGFDQFNNRIFRMDGDTKITRRLEFIQDGSTSIKGQFGGYRSMLRKEYPDAVESKIVYEKIEADELAVKLCGAIAISNANKKL